MSLDLLVKEIEDGLKKELDRLNKEAELRIKEIRKEKEEEIKNLRNENKQRLDGISKKMKEKFESSLNIDKKRILLRMNEELMEKLKEKFKEEILKLSKADKKKIYVKFYNEASKVIDVGVIKVNKKDKDLVESLTDKVEVDDNIEWGLVFVSKDGYKILDYSLDEVVNELIESNKDVVRKVFD